MITWKSILKNVKDFSLSPTKKQNKTKLTICQTDTFRGNKPHFSLRTYDTHKIIHKNQRDFQKIG